MWIHYKNGKCKYEEPAGSEFIKNSPKNKSRFKHTQNKWLETEGSTGLVSVNNWDGKWDWEPMLGEADYAYKQSICLEARLGFRIECIALYNEIGEGIFFKILEVKMSEIEARG